MNQQPRFIVLDGIDGAGKSSQIMPLAQWLRSIGQCVVTCRDPGSTLTGDSIRTILLDRRDLAVSLVAEMLLYMAARAQLVSEVIRPALDRGSWVISDRFLLSNVVYQGHAGGLDPESIRRVGAIATGGLEPDLTILLDLDPVHAADRISRPLDKLEERGEAYRASVRAGYCAEASRFQENTVMIDASGGFAEVAASICRLVSSRYSLEKDV